MKNRRSIIVAFLVCACLLVGVGYAAFAGNLIINGTATYTHDGEEIDEAVKFSGYSNLSHCNVTIAETGDTATMDVVVTKADAVNDVCTATATFIISNGSTEDLTFSNPGTIAVNGTELFTVTTDWTEDKLVAAGTTVEITITVTANVNSVTEDQFGSFVVQLPAVIA